MNILASFVGGRWAESVGWALLHSLWQGGVVCVFLALTVLATKSPRIRYSTACSALFVTFSAFVITLLRLAPPAALTIRVARTMPAPVWREALLHNAGAWNVSLAAIAPWLPPFWIAGVFVFYLRYAAGFVALSRLKRRGTCFASETWQHKLAALCERLRVSRPVLLLESSLAEAPMVLGHFRPLILMPIGLFSGLPNAQIEAILLHELAHIRRRDYLLNAWQNMIEGLLFYNPAIWWISHVIRSEREKCCDDVVVCISGDAPEYARALAALEQNRYTGREPAVAAKGGSLMKRIRRILYPQTGAPLAWAPILAAVLLSVFAAATMGAWQNNPPRSSPIGACSTSADGGTPSDLSAPFQKWLNEDVFYIIDDAERAAFLKLATNDERACFVEQFWERRNPTPGAAENRFKEEHYRRIAYANAHFAASVPGWQTDRGHMYIVYGPPDEIDAHPHTTPRPYETWGYRHVEGMTEGGVSYFNFIDRTGHGDYHLAPSNAH